MTTGEIYLGNDASAIYPSVKNDTVGKRHSALARDLQKKLMEMPIEELKQLTLQKASNGCASSLAVEASKALWKRRTYLGER